MKHNISMFKKKFVKNEEIETKTKDLVKAPYKYHFGWAIIIWDILLSCLIGTTGGVQKIENQKIQTELQIIKQS